MNGLSIKGFNDLTFENSELFYRLSHEIYEIYRRYGALPLRTSIIKPMSVLNPSCASEVGKTAAERILMTLMINDQKVALRYDQTEPTSAYILAHRKDISFPLRVNASGMVFRREEPNEVALGEKQQEFFQTDFDIVDHTDRFSLYYDYETICILYEVLSKVMGHVEGGGVPQIRFNNRKLIDGLIIAMGMQNNEVFEKDLLIVLDGYYKMDQSVFVKKLEQILLQYGKEDYLSLLITIFSPQNSPEGVENTLRETNVSNHTLQEALEEILYIQEKALSKGIAIVFDPLTIRGLDIYTGTVFEGYIEGGEAYGAIAGGGRYDNLGNDIIRTQNLIDMTSLSGVGFSIGLDRIIKFIQNNKRERINLVDVVVGPNLLACMGKTSGDVLEVLSTTLRQQGKKVNIVPFTTKSFDSASYVNFYAPKQFVNADESGMFVEQQGERIYVDDRESLQRILLS